MRNGAASASGVSTPRVRLPIGTPFPSCPSFPSTGTIVPGLSNRQSAMKGAATTNNARGGPPPTDRFVAPATDIVEVLDRLEREDAVAVPALTAEYRAWLIEEARATQFREARPVVGRGERLVHQRMGVHNGFRADSRFHDLTRHYQAAWDRWLAAMASNPFESPLVFNDLMLQVYEPGETGITPHMDRTDYRNLICLFVLEGRGRFGICRGPERARDADRRPRARRRGADARARVQGLRLPPVPLSRSHYRAALRVRTAARALQRVEGMGASLPARRSRRAAACLNRAPPRPIWNPDRNPGRLVARRAII